MRAIGKLGVAAAIVVVAYLAIVRVAEEKANALAGGQTFALGPQSRGEWAAFGALLEQLRGWGEPELADALRDLQEGNALWVAPHLEGGRSAVYVNASRLISRVFVRGDELVPREIPFPDLDVPEPAQRTFATIRLAGTLLHELQHYEGLEDEAETYEREIDWYYALSERMLDRLEGEERHWFEWAVESAIETAFVAKDNATE